MKIFLTLAFVCGALFAGGCSDNSLVSDEEYEAMKGPAAYPPDPARHMPQSAAQRSMMGGARY